MMRIFAFFVSTILAAMIFLSGCYYNDVPAIKTDENINIIPENFEIPDWAKPAPHRGQLFQNLNLDGIGDADDEVYISIYQWSNTFDAATVISIHLGTGETLAKVYPVYGIYSLQTGLLFSQDKVAVVLELSDPRTNWGAASIIVLDIFPAEGDSSSYIWERINTMEDSIKNNHEELIVERDRIVVGTDIVEIDESVLDGLAIPYLSADGKKMEQLETIYWNNDSWHVLLLN